jgi:hypothetical protein
MLEAEARPMPLGDERFDVKMRSVPINLEHDDRYCLRIYTHQSLKSGSDDSGDYRSPCWHDTTRCRHISSLTRLANQHTALDKTDKDF